MSNYGDTAFADLTASVVNEVDPYGRTGLGQSVKEQMAARPMPTRKAPGLGAPPSRPAPGAPNRPAPGLQASYPSQSENQPPGFVGTSGTVNYYPQSYEHQQESPAVDPFGPNAANPFESTTSTPPPAALEAQYGSSHPHQQHYDHHHQQQQQQQQQYYGQVEQYGETSPQYGPSPTSYPPSESYPTTDYHQQQPYHQYHNEGPYHPDTTTMTYDYGAATTDSYGSYTAPATPFVFPDVTQPSPSVYDGVAHQPIVLGESSTTFDPFFGDEIATTSAVTDNTTKDGEENAASSSDDSDSDSDSDLEGDEHHGEITAFDDQNSLATIIPMSFPSATVLREFLLTPIDSEQLCKCLVMFDPTEKLWTFTNSSTGVRLMTAFKRKDGLKRLTTQVVWAIDLSPRAIVREEEKKAGSRFGFGTKRASSKSLSSDVNYVAKCKSNVNGSVFEVYDTGLNPSKAVGAMHARRELGAIRFEKSSHDPYRRKAKACVPEIGANRRPTSKKDQLFERMGQGDKTVVPLVNHIPGRSLFLPRLSDFNGMALSSSIKNTILHNPKDPQGDTIFVIGKANKTMFNVYFKQPISPVVAFAFALASISSKVTSSS